MSTVLTECRYVINSRPLLLQGQSDIDNISITPNDLMFGRKFSNLPPLNFKGGQLPKTSVFARKRLKYLNTLHEAFWKKFHTDYLNELTTYHFQARGKAPQGDKTPKIDDICLIKNVDTPRSTWKLARVVSLHPGPDGLVRRVGIKPATSKIGDGRTPETFRAPSHLCPLEMATTDNC